MWTGEVTRRGWRGIRARRDGLSEELVRIGSGPVFFYMVEMQASGCFVGAMHLYKSIHRGNVGVWLCRSFNVAMSVVGDRPAASFSLEI